MDNEWLHFDIHRKNRKGMSLKKMQNSALYLKILITYNSY